MRVIVNLLLLPCYLAHVHGLVIPREDPNDWGTELVGLPTIIPVDGPPLPSKTIQGSSDFINYYADDSGALHPLELNPASLNEGFINQLKDSYKVDPFSINKSFLDQLKDSPFPDDPTTVFPSSQSFVLPDDLNSFTQAETIPSPIDDIWYDGSDLFS